MAYASVSALRFTGARDSSTEGTVPEIPSFVASDASFVASDADADFSGLLSVGATGAAAIPNDAAGAAAAAAAASLAFRAAISASAAANTAAACRLRLAMAAALLILMSFPFFFPFLVAGPFPLFAPNLSLLAFFGVEPLSFALLSATSTLLRFFFGFLRPVAASEVADFFAFGPFGPFGAFGAFGAFSPFGDLRVFGDLSVFDVFSAFGAFSVFETLGDLGVFGGLGFFGLLRFGFFFAAAVPVTLMPRGNIDSNKLSDAFGGTWSIIVGTKGASRAQNCANLPQTNQE